MDVQYEDHLWYLYGRILIQQSIVKRLLTTEQICHKASQTILGFGLGVFFWFFFAKKQLFIKTQNYLSSTAFTKRKRVPLMRPQFEKNGRDVMWIWQESFLRIVLSRNHKDNLLVMLANSESWVSLFHVVHTWFNYSYQRTSKIKIKIPNIVCFGHLEKNVKEVKKRIYHTTSRSTSKNTSGVLVLKFNPSVTDSRFHVIPVIVPVLSLFQIWLENSKYLFIKLTTHIFFYRSTSASKV